MANKEQLEILRKGVTAWNQWRKENPDTKIDLSFSNLACANFEKADFFEADLYHINLEKANLSGAVLWNANLRDANLRGANLNYAFLKGANLITADLQEATLRNADLCFSILWGTRLRWSDLTHSTIGQTAFGDVNLSETKGLGKIHHVYASLISTYTLQLFKGKMPHKFLRGCGLSDWEIESAKLYQPGLSAEEVDNILYRVHELRAGEALQITPLFISYSHKDCAFVDKMEKRLDEKGIRFWRDIHDATSGRLEKVVDRAIRQNPIVLLILSENSVKSDWVEHEARTARELEKELGRDVLCPMALDDAYKTCRWPARLREQIMEYNILDFSKWKDAGEFGKMFRKLIDGLDLFYKDNKAGN